VASDILGINRQSGHKIFKQTACDEHDLPSVSSGLSFEGGVITVTSRMGDVVMLREPGHYAIHVKRVWSSGTTASKIVVWYDTSDTEKPNT